MITNAQLTMSLMSLKAMGVTRQFQVQIVLYYMQCMIIPLHIYNAYLYFCIILYYTIL